MSVGQDFITHYNTKHSKNFGVEWAEYSLLYMEFLVAISLYNRFHPKFLRTLPDQLQLQIAERVLFLLNFPNLLLTLEIEWRLNVQHTPTPVRGVPGRVKGPRDRASN